jgi:hypothetical protein
LAISFEKGFILGAFKKQHMHSGGTCVALNLQKCVRAIRAEYNRSIVGFNRGSFSKVYSTTIIGLSKCKGRLIIGPESGLQTT